MNPFERIKEFGIIPVIKIPDESLAEPLAQALIAGGLPLIEITLRNNCAIACIKRVKKTFPEMCVGAGTVLTVTQAEAAKEAGADFVVAPGFDSDIVEYCKKIKMPFLPGCVTPSEIAKGLNNGFKILKFFPSECLGGVKTIKELCGPYQEISFVATSGINMDNLGEYMACNKVAAVGGSFVAPAAMIQKKDWDGITALSKKAVEISLGFHLAHIGINNRNAIEGAKTAQRFSQILGIPYISGNRSDFAGDIVESCKEKFPGTAGHIAIGTLSVERAVVYLKQKGFSIRDEFVGRDSDGKLKAVYLKDEVAGFALHLLRTTKYKSFC
ncbi:MAG: bifunctional 4-hydroxy-2-oxoglutarate aldolase/2-dehydro-3-deoxy-phosphogluconate aldolase [Spirochaetales bacterium]|nr:bifunctional 4-hydroxy-2-oxoglutarate aldolase/2-dehydro-3-deoxy-phosphogluconate aldolase [Spirochaetales bacterium]